MSKNNAPTGAGERIYYTGDRANLEGFGTVLSVSSDEWGTKIEVELDAQPCELEEYSVPPRRFTISPASFSEGPGRRFYRYADHRDARLEKLVEGMNVTREEARERMIEGGWDFQA